MNKRGLFYVMDLIVAFVVMTLGVILILVVQIEPPSTIQLELLADDTIELANTVRVDQVSSPTLIDLRKSGDLTTLDEEKPILLFAHELNLSSDPLLQITGRKVLQELLENEMSAQYNLEINITAPTYSYAIYQYVGGTNVSMSYDQIQATQEDKKIIVKRRSLLVGSTDLGTLIGPFYVEVTVW